MIALARTTPDMEPSYQIGDEIDFGSALDSRCFMRNGWGVTEPWGVWTVERRAELALPVQAKAGDRLVLERGLPTHFWANNATPFAFACAPQIGKSRNGCLRLED